MILVLLIINIVNDDDECIRILFIKVREYLSNIGDRLHIIYYVCPNECYKCALF